ncbi:hypothetical protein AVEN_211050-1 [Araneus ventricosus]|uniref:Uncharacterized protein n=1 Tax=Araneus ventricosus TaxID=182803 RepID=A0A4Y2SYY4_ARAVE|nr:hypothetical protein AVEN_211050-1 [Araneus ventricosus]
MLFTYGLDSIPATKLGLCAQDTRHSDKDRCLFSCRKYSSVSSSQRTRPLSPAGGSSRELLAGGPAHGQEGARRCCLLAPVGENSWIRLRDYSHRVAMGTEADAPSPSPENGKVLISIHPGSPTLESWDSLKLLTLSTLLQTGKRRFAFHIWLFRTTDSDEGRSGVVGSDQLWGRRAPSSKPDSTEDPPWGLLHF